MTPSYSKAALAALTLIAGFGVVSCQQAQTQTVDPKKMAALKDAVKNGVITQQEYDAKVAQLANSGSGKTAPKTVTDPSKVTWTTLSVTDPIFNMPAFTVTLPSDWTFEGAVLRGSCGDDVPMYVYRASSPDGLTGIQAMPRVDWYFAQDSRAIKGAGVAACNLHPAVPAAQQAADIAAKARPQPQLGPVEHLNAPGLDAFADKTNKAFSDQAKTYGRPNDAGHLTIDSERIRLNYNFEGHPEEEWLMVQTYITDQGVAVMGTGQYGILKSEMSRMQHTQIYVSGFRAPKGSLESSEPLLGKIQASVKLVPEYDKTYQALKNRQFAQAQALRSAVVGQVLKSGQDSQAALMSQHNSYMTWQQQQRDANNQKFQADMARKDSQSQNFLDYVGNQQYYVNPETGATVTVQNVPGANGVVARSTTNGNWVELAPISH